VSRRHSLSKCRLLAIRFIKRCSQKYTYIRPHCHDPQTSTTIIPHVGYGGSSWNQMIPPQIPPASEIWWNQMSPPLYSTRSHQIPPDTRSHHIPAYPTNIMRLGVKTNVLMRLNVVKNVVVRLKSARRGPGFGRGTGGEGGVGGLSLDVDRRRGRRAAHKFGQPPLSGGAGAPFVSFF
jgi:hypothetical protein